MYLLSLSAERIMASIMSFSYLEIYFTDPKVNAITAKY